MEDRIMKLYKELDFLLNNSPAEDDNSDEQNGCTQIWQI